MNGDIENGTMDNVASHKCTTIKEFIIALSPIEEAFSKWKNAVCRSNCMSSSDLSVSIESDFD